MGESLHRVAHDLGVGEGRRDLTDAVHETSASAVDLRALGERGLQRGRRREAAGDVRQRTTEVLGLGVPWEGVRPSRPAADHQDADGAGPAPRGRVTGSGRPPGLGQVDHPQGGGAVHEERYAVGQLEPAGRLDGADLVVRELAGDCTDVATDGVLDQVAVVGPPPGVHAHLVHLAVVTVGPPAGRVPDVRVLDRGDDQPGAAVEPRLGQAQEAALHGVERAGEPHLVAAHGQGVGHRLAGVVQQQSRVPTGTVQRAGVGVPPGEGGVEDLAGGRVQGSARGCVEVCVCHAPTLRPGRPNPHPGPDVAARSR